MANYLNSVPFGGFEVCAVRFQFLAPADRQWLRFCQTLSDIEHLLEDIFLSPQIGFLHLVNRGSDLLQDYLADFVEVS